MAGYRKKEKIYVLKFEDMEGLEVRARGSSVGELMDLMALARLGGGHKFTAEDVKDIDGLFGLFASKLISWNLETEDGAPITFDPEMVTLYGSDGSVISRLETDAEAKTRVFRAQDMDFAMDLVLAWVDAVIGVPAPLEQKSDDGAPWEAGSIPMEVLSPSLPH